MSVEKVPNKARNAIEVEMAKLLRASLLVGIPDRNADRKPVEGEKQPASNAFIGYVQEFGDDEKRIPPRPFLVPGVESVKPELATLFANAAASVLAGGSAAKALVPIRAAGLLAADAVKAKITDGPFAPLSPKTIAARARRGRKGARQYLKLKAQGVPVEVLNDPGVGLVKPLIDTGQLRRAVTYVIDKG